MKDRDPVAGESAAPEGRIARDRHSHGTVTETAAVVSLACADDVNSHHAGLGPALGQEDDEMAPDAQDAWDQFLNPDVVRQKLAQAGVFLIAFETLRDAVVRHPRTYFATAYSGPGLEPEESPDYQREVRGRDPREKGDVLRGSLAFLSHVGAISEDDEQLFRRLADIRNTTAHELPTFVMQGRNLECADHLPHVLWMLRKVERWWWLNVELPTNPDTAAAAVYLSPDDVQPGSALMIEVLTTIATGDDALARGFYEAFRSGLGRGESPT